MGAAFFSSTVAAEKAHLNLCQQASFERKRAEQWWP